jgi:hypothetical protein
MGNMDSLVYHQVILLASGWVSVCYYTRHNIILGCSLGGVIPLDCYRSIKVQKDECVTTENTVSACESSSRVVSRN